MGGMVGLRGFVAERNPKTFRRPQGVSGGVPSVEGGVDEFAKRRRTALKGLKGPQNCYESPLRRAVARWWWRGIIGGGIAK
jgi:hypothetical protein